MSDRGTATTRRVDSVEDLWCWANTWGDLGEHRKQVGPQVLSDAWAKGYEKAIDDFMSRLGEMGVGFEQAREAWRSKWSGVQGGN